MSSETNVQGSGPQSQVVRKYVRQAPSSCVMWSTVLMAKILVQAFILDILADPCDSCHEPTSNLVSHACRV